MTNDDHYDHIDAAEYHMACWECIQDLVCMLERPPAWPAGTKLRMIYGMEGQGE